MLYQQEHFFPAVNQMILSVRTYLKGGERFYIHFFLCMHTYICPQLPLSYS